MGEEVHSPLGETPQLSVATEGEGKIQLYLSALVRPEWKSTLFVF